MAEPQENRTPDGQTPQQESGIFEPKPISADHLPLTGAQKGWRIAAVIAVLLLAFTIWLLLKNPFMKPVNQYYKGLSKRNTAAMSEAFPGWLTSAKKDEDSMGIADMCVNVSLYYGKESTVKVSLISKQDVERDYLDRIEAGIKTQYQTDVTISEGVWLKLLAAYRKKDGSETEQIQYARVYKINGRWVMLDVPSETE